MGDIVKIKSGGRFANTAIHLGGYDIPPGDLNKVQLYWEPGVDQVVCELKFVKDGRLLRWAGANVDDDFAFELEAQDEHETLYRVTSDGKNVMVFAGKDADALVRIMPNGPKVLEIVANGWALQANNYFEQIALGVPHV